MAERHVWRRSGGAASASPLASAKATAPAVVEVLPNTRNAVSEYLKSVGVEASEVMNKAAQQDEERKEKKRLEHHGVGFVPKEGAKNAQYDKRHMTPAQRNMLRGWESFTLYPMALTLAHT